MSADNTPVRYRDARVGGCLSVDIERLADGSTVLRSPERLQSYPMRLSDRLAQWAAQSPDRTFVARRPRGGDWVRLSYADALQRARSLGQALLDSGLSKERPLAILSGNDLEHASLMLAAMWVGVPCVSVSAAYSLVSTDYAKLRHILANTTPGMVYASGAAHVRAIAATVAADVPLTFGDDVPADALTALPHASVRRFGQMLDTPPGPAVDSAHALTGPGTVVKVLFTSGSTRQPKGVITTHRMLCANQQMLRQTMAFLADAPPVLVDWLPWSHTFGGNHNLGIALYNGGTLYIDDGKPTPDGIAETIRNLKEISPSVYFNVPKGLEELADAMSADPALRASLFRRLQVFMFAAAGLSQAVWDKLDAHGVAACGERVRIVTSLGMTETAPSCTFLVGTHARSGDIGLPCPGVEARLVAVDGKTEIRFRGPNVMPGYWREPAQTAAAFDEQGFYRTGDAVCWIDEDDPQRGLRFDGRIAEDFKLSTGTFVSVGPLRSRVVLQGHPYVQDVVLTAPNRDDLGALVFPRLPECRHLAGLPEDAPAAEVLHHPRVRAQFQQLCTQLHAQGTGSANRIARMHLLEEPPSIDAGEITDKNSINQRAVLTRRAALVDAMHAGQAADPWLILPGAH